MQDRLGSWKEIAAHLGRDIRTVQRWETERGFPVHRLPGGDKPRVYALRSEIDAWLRTAPAEETEPASVAVLPFANLTADKESEYFGDGLADEIINVLTRIPGLRVTARTSSFAFRNKEQDVRDIGARLGVASLLEGSVRRQDDRVRVCAQLVNAQDGYHLWSETYDRRLADIFAVQDDLAASIARALKAQLAPGPLVEQMTEDMEAYCLWLRGRCLGAQYTPDAIAAARQCFEAAIARDPAFPLPYVALAELVFEASQFCLLPASQLREGKRALIRALDLNDRIGEAHALLGAYEAVLEYDWAAAGGEFQRAIELSPGSSVVLARYAWSYLMPKLRLAEAVSTFRRAVALDPLSPFVHTFLGLALTMSRQFASAIEECRTAVELSPDLWWPHWMLAGALIFEGRPDEAIAEAELAARIYGAPGARYGLTAIYGLLGRTGEARRQFEEVQRTTPNHQVQPLTVAWGYLGIGDDRVFEWLEKAIDARDPAVLHMPSMPIYDGIRGDPRFQALLAKMHLA